MTQAERRALHGADRIHAVETALRAIRAGRMVVVVDDEDRENEGDFVMAAERCTPADVNFMTRDARGLLCVSMPAERLEELGLSLMAPLNTARFAAQDPRWLWFDTEAYVFVGLIYFVGSTITSQYGLWLERHLRTGG